MSQNCECGGAPEKPINVPVTSINWPTCGLSLNIDGKNISGGIEPGPDGTHLVTRNGEIAWEAFSDTESMLMPRDLYVAEDGDDANDGFTPETAKSSLQAAADSTKQFVQVGKIVTIHVAAGTYAGDVSIDARQGHYPILHITGDGSASTVVNGQIKAYGSQYVYFSNAHVRGKSPFTASWKAHLSIEACQMTATEPGGGPCYASNQAILQLQGTTPMLLEGINGTGYMLRTQVNGLIRIAAPLVMNGFATQIAYASTFSQIYMASTGQATGNVTGRQYYSCDNSVIYVPQANLSQQPAKA